MKDATHTKFARPWYVNILEQGIDFRRFVANGGWPLPADRNF
jgi:hypothetical protein